MIRKRILVFGFAVFLTAIATSDAFVFSRERWPQFRGSDSKGIVDGQNLPDRWSATENVAWRCDLPGRGRKSIAHSHVGENVLHRVTAAIIKKN